MVDFSAFVPRIPTETAPRASRRLPPRQRARSQSVAAEPTRERILSAAAQLFAQQGFASTSMPAIAERSGITAGAIYRHFESKAELLLEVVKRALGALPLSFERSSGTEDAALLPEFAARLTDPALALLRQLAVEVYAAARLDPEVRTLLAAYNETALQKIRALLEGEQQTSSRDARGASEFTARALMVFLVGLNHMDTLHPQLVGDRAWREFVASYVARLLGLTLQGRGRDRRPEDGRPRLAQMSKGADQSEPPGKSKEWAQEK